MAKANIVEKKTIAIRGTLSIDEETNIIIVEIEDGDSFPLATLLSNFNGSEVSMSVAESNDIA